MKKILTQTTFVAVLLITFGLHTNTMHAQTTEQKTIWDYPVKPGTEAWAAFETNEQMVRACQIPLHILNTISTKELVTICLNYPLSNNYYMANDERKAVNVTIRQFNGLQELSQRKDGVRELTNTYTSYPVLSKVERDVDSKDYHTPYK